MRSHVARLFEGCRDPRINNFIVADREIADRVTECVVPQECEGTDACCEIPGIRVELGWIKGCRMKIHYTADDMFNLAQSARGGFPGGPVQSFSSELDGRLEPERMAQNVREAWVNHERVREFYGWRWVREGDGGGGDAGPEGRDWESG